MQKTPEMQVWDSGLIPGLGRSLGGGNGNPFQYSCLENSIDTGAWWATVHGVAKSWTWLTTHTHTHTPYIHLITASLSVDPTADPGTDSYPQILWTKSGRQSDMPRDQMGSTYAWTSGNRPTNSSPQCELHDFWFQIIIPVLYVLAFSQGKKWQGGNFWFNKSDNCELLKPAKATATKT